MPVLNNTVLSALSRVGQLPLLRDLYPSLKIPTAVRDEALEALVAIPNWIAVVPLSVAEQDEADRILLDRGEREALVLAKRLNDLLITDDRRAREEADRRGIAKTGTFGVLISAYISCYLNRGDFEEVVTEAKENLYHTPELLADVMRREKPQGAGQSRIARD